MLLTKNILYVKLPQASNSGDLVCGFNFLTTVSCYTFVYMLDIHFINTIMYLNTIVIHSDVLPHLGMELSVDSSYSQVTLQGKMFTVSLPPRLGAEAQNHFQKSREQHLVAVWLCRGSSLNVWSNIEMRSSEQW